MWDLMKRKKKEESESKELQIKKKMSHDEGKIIQPHEHTKKVRLCEDVHDKLVTIAKDMTKKKKTLRLHAYETIKMCLLGARQTLRVYHAK
jgi:hypothetical protein